MSSFFFLGIFVENSTVVSTKVSWERKRPEEVKNLRQLHKSRGVVQDKKMHQSANSFPLKLFGRTNKTIAFSSGNISINMGLVSNKQQGLKYTFSKTKKQIL